MIKLVIFDMDGVLADARDLHYQALNEALPAKFRISISEHLSKYDGLSTKKKLNLLKKDKGMPESLFDLVWSKKQALTDKVAREVFSTDVSKAEMCCRLHGSGIHVACASNSIRSTIITILDKIGVLGYVDYVYGNDDVRCSKPSAEMYLRCMIDADASPAETVIVEDSVLGRKAAKSATDNVLCVSGPEEVTYERVSAFVEKCNNSGKSHKWEDGRLNVVIPMAGSGTRFTNAGYTFPKPLIDVNGKPMIEAVVDNINIDANYIFIVQKEHVDNYNIDSMLEVMCPRCKVVQIDGMTEGAACTVLKARAEIDNDRPLFMANCDQLTNWDSADFMWAMNSKGVDAGIATFTSTHPKWSFAKVEEGIVVEVAEKKPISDRATVGYYYWAKGSDFVKYADRMIAADTRVNNEFYVCPVFNEAIADGLVVKEYQVEKMWGIGTPEDLESYLRDAG